MKSAQTKYTVAITCSDQLDNNHYSYLEPDSLIQIFICSLQQFFSSQQPIIKQIQRPLSINKEKTKNRNSVYVSASKTYTHTLYFISCTSFLQRKVKILLVITRT